MSDEGRALRRDAERNRSRILEGARALFAERGLDVSLDDVAKHSDVGVGTVYRRFPDKQSLVDAIYVAHLAEAQEALERGLEHTDAWEGFTSASSRVFEMLAADRGFTDLLFSDAYGSACVADARAGLWTQAERLIGRAQDAGAVRSDVGPADVRLLAIMLTSVIDSTRDVDREQWRRMLDPVLEGIRARDDTAPLPLRALEPEQVDAVMRAARARR